MSCLVISDLSDQLNLGSYFLKQFYVSLEFSNNHPLKLYFKNLGEIQSVGSLKNIPNSHVHVPHISHSDQNTTFHIPLKSQKSVSQTPYSNQIPHSHTPLPGQTHVFHNPPSGQTPHFHTPPPDQTNVFHIPLSEQNHFSYTPDVKFEDLQRRKSKVPSKEN